MRILFTPARIVAIVALISAIGLSSCQGLIPDIDDVITILTAEAGNDQTVLFGKTVTLDGSGSKDSGNKPFEYAWTFASKPNESSATITNATTASPSFIPDALGTYVVMLTISNDNKSSSDQVTITVEEDPDNPITPKVITQITSNTTLKKIADEGPDYCIRNVVTVLADLVIEPGVVIEFAEGAGIYVSSTGSMSAVGTANESITFTGKTKEQGHWKGIVFASNTSSNHLSHTIVEYGGHSGFDGAGLIANIMVESGGKVKLDNNIIRKSEGYGIFLRDREVQLASFSQNTISGNFAPVMASVNLLHQLTADNTYTNNSKNYIDMYASGVSIADDVTWKAIGVDYRLPGSVEYIDAAVEIEPGVNFVVQSNGGLQVLANGSLKAIGTTSDEIVFKGEQDEVGYWRGLNFRSNNPNNTLSYVSISNGGSQGFDGANIKANIMVDNGGRLQMDHTSSWKSGGAGLHLRDVEVQMPNFSTNAFFGNVYPIVGLVHHYHFLDVDSDYSGNTNDFIQTEYSNKEITQDVTWQAISIPYRLAESISYLASAITIADGATFLGSPKSGIQVMTTGSLSAVGTASQGITFKGEQNVTGYWRGIQFRSNNPNNKLTFVTVTNGGSEGFDGGNRKANIELYESALLTIKNSTITNSGGYGVRVLSLGVLTETGNTYSGNLSAGNKAGGGVQNDN